MDARDVAAMTADALNSMEQRLEGSIAKLKHDIELLSVKVDVNHRTTVQQMDEGFPRSSSTSTAGSVLLDDHPPQPSEQPAGFTRSTPFVAGPASGETPILSQREAVTDSG